MQPTPTEPTPSAIARTAVTDEEKEPNEQARDLESLSNPAAGTVIATVQQEPTSEDDANDASDSGVGEEVESTTTSLRSSAEEYVTKNGRRYQNPEKWFVPKDQCEQDRMDLRHELSIMTLGERLLVSQDSLSSAPRVLDVGTGTGLWAIDIADKYSGGGEVVGIDLSPIQPRWVPPNCHFLVDDAEKTWDDSKKYNLVHIRYMEGAFTDWPWIFEQVMTVLEPGGIIEVHGIDFCPYAQEGEVPEVILTWIAQLYDLTKKRGRPIDVIGGYETWMEAAGFMDVEKHEFAQPLGPWAKDKRQKTIGGLNLEATLNGVEAYTLEPFREAGWSLKEATVLIALVRHACQENWYGNQLHTKLVVVTARKPGGAR